MSRVRRMAQHRSMLKIMPKIWQPKRHGLISDTSVTRLPAQESPQEHLLTMITPMPIPTPPITWSLDVKMSSITLGQLWSRNKRGDYSTLEKQHITEETKAYLLSFWYRCDKDFSSLLFGTDFIYSINQRSCWSTAAQLNKSTKKTVSQIIVKLFVLHSLNVFALMVWTNHKNEHSLHSELLVEFPSALPV